MTKEKEYTRYINDPIMDPFFISMDDSCITVNAKIMPDARYTTSTKESGPTPEISLTHIDQGIHICIR